MQLSFANRADGSPRRVVRLEKTYEHTVFTADVIKEAFAVLEQRITQEDKTKYDRTRLSAETTDGTWSYDTEEEFFNDYRRGAAFAHYGRNIGPSNHEFIFNVHVFGSKTDVSVTAPTRSDVLAVFDVFEKHRAASFVPVPIVEPSKPTVFIGHGGSTHWRDLKDHLQDQHGYQVEAYEVGARAGHTIRDILDDMLGKSSFAVLVMSAEDKGAEGRFHARPNVIHELGLFQGKLGFSKAIVLLEEGTEEFSNIHGIQQIRYGKGNIKETYGDVLATLRREFGNDSRDS